MKRRTNFCEKGITLVALVITIIILLILIGVMLNTALSDNGLFKIAKTTVKNYNLEREREALSMSVTSYQIGKSLNEKNEDEKIGEELNTRNLNNTSNWHIIKVNEKSYETGWNYIEKGTELKGYGNAQNSWLINYETGEVIQLEEDNYISLSAGDMLAVKDNLIISIDSSIVDKGAKTIKEVEDILGSGVTLHGFSEIGTEESGLTNESFNFDGEDDWIEIDYDNVERKKELIENGFTFEFYGDTAEAQAVENGIKITNPDNNGGGFGLWDGNENHFAKLHFNILRKDKLLAIKWTGATGEKTYPEIKSDDNNVWGVIGRGKGDGWNAITEPKLDNAGDFYVTVTFNPKSSKQLNNETVYEMKLYINGNYIGNGWYYKGYWDNLRNEINNLNKICIAKTSMNADNYWLYPKMKIYALRLYSRVLTDEEVNKNYEKSVEYHSLLTK